MMDDTLKGVPGQATYQVSQDGSRLPNASTTIDQATAGRDVQLTVDNDIQWYAQNALAAKIKETDAESGTAVVMDAKTGELVALASFPTFDPNDIGDADGAAADDGEFVRDPVDMVGTYEVPDGALFFDSGGTGNWNQDLNNPLPDSTYVVDDRFVFTTDEQGRVVETHGVLELGDADRNSYQQTKAGGDDRQPGDQGGHIFGNAFGGPGEALNLLAMSAEANGAREYGQLEALWRTELAKTPPPVIEMQMTPLYEGDSQRPTEMIIDWTLDGEIQPQRIIDNG